MDDDTFSWASEKTKDRIIVGLIGIVVGTGIGGGAGYFRVDKFTGSQGDALIKRINSLEKSVYKLPPDWLKEKVTENSIKIRHIELEIQRMRKDHSFFWGDFNKRYKTQ